MSAEASSPVDMLMNLPPQPAAARLSQHLAKGLAAVQRRADLLALLNYRQTAGNRDERRAGCDWLKPRLGDVSADRVVVSAGAQSALTALLMRFARPGAVVVTEALTYPGFRALAADSGVELVGVEMDGEGLRPEALDQACIRHRPVAVYCTPTIHNPTTATMSEARREAVAAVARKHGVLIFEDDVYGRLPRRAPPPIAALAPDITYYVGSLAKTVAPGLRVAYCVAPDAGKAVRLAAMVRSTTYSVPPLMAALAAEWITNGAARAILDAIRKESEARQNIARDVLTGCSFVADPHGHHVWLSVPASWRALELASYLRTHGVAVVSADAFSVSEPAPNAVRLSLGAARDRDELRQQLQLVRSTLAHAPRDLLTVV
jgi:DNA-binding transcriptional MocR family regulator